MLGRRYNRWIRSSENRLTLREDGKWTRFGETYWLTHDKIMGLRYKHSWRKNYDLLDNRIVFLEGKERRRMHAKGEL